MLAVFEKIMDGIQKQKRNNIEGQVNLFMDIMDNKESSMDIKYPNIKEFDKKIHTSNGKRNDRIIFFWSSIGRI